MRTTWDLPQDNKIEAEVFFLVVCLVLVVYVTVRFILTGYCAMFQRQQQFFFTLLFSSLLFSFLFSQEIIEDGCDCYKPKPNTEYRPTLSVGSQRPGFSFTKALELGPYTDPVEEVAYIRAHYNYPTDYTFICDRYFYGISDSSYETNLSKDEYQEIAKEWGVGKAVAIKIEDII